MLGLRILARTASFTVNGGFQNYQGCILAGSHRDCEDHIAVCPLWPLFVNFVSYDPGNASRVLSARAERTTPLPPGTRRDSPLCSPRTFIFGPRGWYTHTLNPGGSGIPYWRWETASLAIREPQEAQKLAQTRRRRKVRQHFDDLQQHHRG